MITENIGLILVVTGAMTAGVGVGGFLFPRNFLHIAFRVEESGEALTLVTRHWGLLGFLLGALMIYTGFESDLRVPVVMAATIEKIVFAGLVFFGPLKKSGLAKAAAAGDSFMALLYVLYLLGF